MIARVVILIFLLTGCSRSAKFCQVCQREECTGLAFRVTLEDGKRVETCCPRCGLHYLEANQVKARRMEATDYATGKWIEAKDATYVEGSDVSHCASAETKRDQFGCCYFKGYDRCLPSLIAFAKLETATTFQRDHGGKFVQLNQTGDTQ